MRFEALWAPALVAAAILLGCGNGERSKPGLLRQKKPLHLVFITVDTLRKDYLGCYGNPRIYTPHMDELSKKGTLFQTCLAPLGKTNPSIASILTAKYPHEHSVRSLWHVLPEKETTLTEVLKERGYATAFVNGNNLLGPQSGITQGFDYYEGPQGGFIRYWDKTKAENFTIKEEEQNPLRILSAASAERITNLAIKRIEKLKEREKIFLWVHYMDPHWSYHPPSPWNRTHTKSVDADFEKLAAESLPVLQFQNSLSDNMIEYFKGLYAGEVEYTDYHIGRLLNKLTECNILHDCLLVFSSDHGEALGEKEFFFCHGDDVYRESLDIPLIFYSTEDLPFSDILEQPVQTTSLFSAVIKLLGTGDTMQKYDIPHRPLIDKIDNDENNYLFAETDGWTPKENPRRYIPGALGKWRMIRDDRYKLIRIPHPEKDILELYDLKNDSAELINLAGKNSRREEILKAKLEEWAAEDPASKDDTPEEPPDEPSIKQKLKSLGYIQ